MTGQKTNLMTIKYFDGQFYKIELKALALHVKLKLMNNSFQNNA